MYQKVGMFGMPNVEFNLPGGDNGHKGDQVRGFGFLHDGSTDTLLRFFQADVFALLPPLSGFSNDGQRRDMEEFMLAFPSDLAPIVGQQVTDDGSGIADVVSRITLLRDRASAAFVSKFLGGSVTECDLVVKGLVAGLERGYLYNPVAVVFDSDRIGDPPLDQTQMDAIAEVDGQYLTYTCAPPGSGTRMGIDRDLDGALDRDELDSGTDPANTGSIVTACSDGQDNDGDGLTDAADPACAAGATDIENPQCSDGVDNDGDGNADGADVDCVSDRDDIERAVSSRCGLGSELVLVLMPLMALRRRLLGRS